MTDIDFIIHASAAVTHCLGVQHRAAERAFPRGTALIRLAEARRECGFALPGGASSLELI